MKPPVPKRETERVRALREFALLDTEPEQDYDNLVILASRICGCPISTVTLIDEERQWFKAVVGLTKREDRRDVAFCAHAVAAPNELLVVPDATADVRFADNPLVTGDPHIRFYAGVPLTTADGDAVGTLCVIDRQPRTLSPEQREALTALARQAMRLMELKRAAADLARALSRVTVLEGLLPTCCHCKDIRDEHGKWHPIELYVMERSAASFSHGICPKCAQRLYPDLDLTKP